MSCNSLNASDAFNTMFDKLINQGEESSPRGQRIKEFLNQKITIENPFDNIVNCDYRKISKKYLVHEFIWYLMAKQDKTGSDYICKHAKFWDTLRNPDGSLNSNYGFYFLESMNNTVLNNNKFDFNVTESQFDWVINKLRKDPDSRQAVVNINSIYHKFHETKDFPCTTAMQFFIRNNQLHMTVTMRSTDLVLGFCNDVFQFTMFQAMVLNTLNRYNKQENKPLYTIGTYTLFTGSLHIYERHWNMKSNTKELGTDYYKSYTINNDFLVNPNDINSLINLDASNCGKTCKELITIVQE